MHLIQLLALLFAQAATALPNGDLTHVFDSDYSPAEYESFWNALEKKHMIPSLKPKPTVPSEPVSVVPSEPVSVVNRKREREVGQSRSFNPRTKIKKTKKIAPKLAEEFSPAKFEELMMKAEKELECRFQACEERILNLLKHF